MNNMGKWVAWLMAAVLIVGLSSCISEDDEEKKEVLLTWEMVARFVDQQLGEISDGTPLTCNGEGQNLGAGAHCKDQLQGTVTQSTIVQYVELGQDTVLFDGDTAFYTRGFWPMTLDPCKESLDGDLMADYSQACPGGGSLVCTDYDNGHVKLAYANCLWMEDGPDTWELDGTIDLYYYATSNLEQLLIATTRNFSGENQTPPNVSYAYSGDVVFYSLLNPFTGGMAMGTTGTGPDGMEIISVSVTVDMDGDGVDDNTYPLVVAFDYEDGVVFLSGKGSAVWLSNPGAPTAVFYARGYDWDNTGTGCQVTVTSVDGVARTFDYTSPNGCIADAAGVSY